ncbi:nematocyst expressed protein 4-like [Eupeodes corollae]|uniref:nematocyst expressed protein 4-like n=1 Tax=Eupeodes corollae TaxID=290404 RepID=UPI002491B100|nr:nematocyst expressed protein 4-like [Eupeodes corollae]
MYFKNICFILLASIGPYVIGGAQNFESTNSQNPWIQNEKDNKHHPHSSAQHSPQYTSEYPSEYTPYYPPQYTPPYPTQSRPQNPWQSKPPLTVQNKPRPSTSTTTTLRPSPPPPPPVQHQHHQPHPVHHNQISNPSIKPTTTTPTGYPSQALDQYNHVYPDGSYEFRYELPDETVRYEKGYFIHYHHKQSLVVRGYYSYRLPGKGYLTVFYTADHYGYRQDSYGITQNRPQLPRSLGERRLLEDEEAINIVSSINENKLQ